MLSRFQETVVWRLRNRVMDLSPVDSWLIVYEFSVTRASIGQAVRLMDLFIGEA